MLDVSTPQRMPTASRADRNVKKASSEHCTGHLVLGDGDGVVTQFESANESYHLLQLNARGEVADLREQVEFRYGPCNEHRHFFDMVATFTSGGRIAFTVKTAQGLASGRFVEEMQIVSWWVRERRFADEVRLLTEADIDPIALHNAKMMAAVRGADPDADRAAQEVASTLTGARCLKDLTTATGLAERGYRALLRLVRTGLLAPERHERITPSTLVYRKGNPQ
jgi:hypothetical protein